MDKPRFFVVVAAIVLGFLFSYAVAGCGSTDRGFPQVALPGDGPYKYEIQHESGFIISSGKVEAGQRVRLPTTAPMTGMYFFFILGDDGWIIGTPVNYVGKIE